MTFHEHRCLLQRMDALICRRATGSATDLADQLDISRASLYRYLDHLRDAGAEIGYCRQRRSYYYEKEFSLK